MPCSDCKFWKEHKHYDVPPNTRQCTRAVQAWDATGFAKDGDGEDDYTKVVLLPEYADRKMFTRDGSQYVAYLLTMPDFHCSEHQPS